MAVSGYMILQPNEGKSLESEAQVQLRASEVKLTAEFVAAAKTGTVFAIESYGFDIEQTLNMAARALGRAPVR